MSMLGPVVDFEAIRKEFYNRLVDARIPGITESNIVNGNETDQSDQAFYVLLSVGGGSGSMVFEQTSERPIMVNMIAVSKGAGEAGRQQVYAASQRIQGAIPAMSPKHSVFADQYGNHFLITAIDPLGGVTINNTFRLNTRATVRMTLKH